MPYEPQYVEVNPGLDPCVVCGKEILRDERVTPGTPEATICTACERAHKDAGREMTHEAIKESADEYKKAKEDSAPKTNGHK